MMSHGSIQLAPATAANDHGAGGLLRTLVIGLTAFLTVVDLFATQAILPTLTRAYGVTPAAMSFAVNACTLGMAVAGLAVALLSRRVDRRRGILASLTLLSVPTALLAEQCSAKVAASAFAAYITGNVASNLVGRLLSAAAADHLGLAWNFYLFALLNLAGALLVYLTLKGTTPVRLGEADRRSPLSIWAEHLGNGPLRATFAIGFCILFAFIGTFTFVNFVLVRPPFALDPMQLGTVYFVFLPSVLTTPSAGRAVLRFGTQRTFWGALAVAGLGLPLLLQPSLTSVLAGLALVAVGTFFAQAIATGVVGRVATTDRGSASGLYLASYFVGGLVGSALLGQVFDRFGWLACVVGIGVALACAALLALRLRTPAKA